MEKQKKIALINDLTGFGRCSTAVMAPIVSAMKIQAVAVPTAILSAHTQFPTYYFDDYTDRMKEYIQTYKDLKLDFDAISTGFLGSELNYCLTYKNMFFPIFFTCVRIHWISKATKIAANKYRIFVCSTSFGI